MHDNNDLIKLLEEISKLQSENSQLEKELKTTQDKLANAERILEHLNIFQPK